MGMRLFGALVATLLIAFAVLRYRKGFLSRGEALVLAVAVAGLLTAAIAPHTYDPLLSPLGLHPGNQRRLIGLLLLSNLFALTLVLRGMTREQQLSQQLANHVDLSALGRFDDEGFRLPPQACAVVIPAFNEGDNIAGVLHETPSHIDGIPVVPIVVADGCTDNTEAVARGHGAPVIRQELRRGQGAAVRVGYRAALRSDARVVVTMDGDGQHDPREMKRLVRPVLAGRADLVQGSRVLGTSEMDSRIRARGVAFYSRVVSAIAHVNITDPSNGYRAVDARALRRLNLQEDQFFTSELMIDAIHKKLRVMEVPITVRERPSGLTKKGTTFSYAWGFGRTIIGTWLRQRAGRHPSHSAPGWLPHSDVRPITPRSAKEMVRGSTD